ncbi:TetR/AcrR family transcriptional regulator [Mycolicibacterium thermoresistibile]|uniref:TetR family transcriptional regulator n=2 Tax=Mycolicibacterium thermoresistibile TaxID=1797 RepID=G7CK61_MYCT3|nr:TetR family transcriptional regulator [Mycolicibacterium thermoresistibile]EHI12848.1 TetR family transcriptional regulator [Mycolicibacterium thermoresistibile ATCC 19527]MCV7189896.1 TetR/AcrR family transcriptional regulator [Mycolicibacterium thermoresistibile]GAT14052.1 TetR family transcriptional regulator [Mycolicibacterium thermoresistibile]SNW19224.1 transcriptional regulator [Mycolicibacterium thermoresistibile]
MASRRAQISEESRRLLIAAATELFAEQGFRRTTFADIAERSGISRGSIPWHFGNKDGLLRAVIEDFIAGVIELDASEQTLSEGLDRIRDYVRRPTTRLLITLVAEAVEPDSPVHAFYAQLHDTLRKWLSDWIDDKDIPPGVSRENFVTVLIGAVIGVHQQWRVAPHHVDLDACFAALKQLASGD